MARAVALLFCAALPAAAHTLTASRTLRLQVREEKLEGFLELHVPPRQAKVYAAAALGDRKRAVAALLPLALEGLSVAPAKLVVSDARVREAPGGALELAVLLELGKAPAKLTLAVESGPPLTATILSTRPLKLVEGAGELPTLRPHPHAPCVVEVR